MAELRHSTAARASNSPAKRDSDASAASSPFLASPSTHGSRGGGGVDDDGKDAHRSSPLLSHHHHKRAHLLTSPFRSLLALEDPRSLAVSSSYRILLALLALILAAEIFCAPLLWSRLNTPYLCHKEGITLHCPETKEPPSLWENPRAATTSWKPCAERRSCEPSDM
ncbi:protein PECTIC ARABINOGALACTAN SYNTHESIS-RELATED-like [Miscanthus floridulus]|uniref:protein PECTIC ARABINOGALACTAN SYNTHESIS-RELATED-like n=1 Tax=Miscanthus floridulus TaxID=154761 RepID=UPI00345B1F7C